MRPLGEMPVRAIQGRDVRPFPRLVTSARNETVAMQLRFPLAVLCCFAGTGVHLFAQDLAPRAYVVTPIHSNAITITSSFYHGGLNFNGTVPITDATGTYFVGVISFYRALNFFGRSANISTSLPYAVGTFRGDLSGESKSLYRSGMLDSSLRFSVNLMGGPAMQPREMAAWKQRRLIGASVRLVVPTGQYSGTKLINWGANRWAVKPELGYSERWGHWVLDGYAGVWLYTTNTTAYAGVFTLPRNEAPVGSLEGHLSYDMKLDLWMSLDGNFWWGGISSLNGIRNLESKQEGSRLGGTVSFPISRHESIKVSYSGGTYVRFGGNYQSVSVAWQYAWLNWPR